MRHTLKNSCLLFLFILLLGCKKEQNPLIGTWISENYPDSKFVFRNDMTADLIRRGSNFSENGPILEQDTTGQYIEHFYGPLNYQYSIVNDTYNIDFIGSNNQKIYRSYHAMIHNNALLTFNYKTLPGIENHIDEVGKYLLLGSEKVHHKSKKIIIVIEEGHEGQFHIAYDQKDGVPPVYDDEGNLVLELEGNILKTQMKADVLVMIYDGFDFKLRTCDSKQIVDINDINHQHYRSLAHQMNKTNDVDIQEKDYSFSGFSLGFNQIGRDYINHIFREEIEGQVGSFTSGFLQDQYIFKDYVKKEKKAWGELKD